MKSFTPQTLKGFRDFLPEEKRKRDFVAKKVIEVFTRFGFEPLETPTLEYASLLLGKYGTEADKLVYQFTDSGNRQIALRYDQTVPTARVLAQYANQLPKYFRRYQVQNVFRADKPQKSRYREFTQCDIDIFGSTSPLADAEIIACTYFAYKNVGYPTIVLKVNDRQTLFSTLKPFATEQVTVFSIIQSIDKLDKKSPSSVAAELVSKGLSASQVQTVLTTISQAPPSSNLRQIITSAISLGVPKSSLQFSPTLARGLDYYTGMIFEVTIPEYPGGSLGGGGRYDDLIKQLSGIDIPAVGIAFGFDRMVEAASALDLIPSEKSPTQVLVSLFEPATLAVSLEVTNQLRQAGINTEVYPNSQDKLDKQLKYANQKNIPYVAIIGPEEISQKVVSLKTMATGEQQQLPTADLVSFLTKGN